MNVFRKPIGLLVTVWMLLVFPLVTLAAGAAEEQEAEPEKGPHRGLMLRDGDFAVELAIFETGVPPEYRAWISDDGEPVDPEEVNLQVVLTRLGNVRDEIGFAPQADFLRGDMEIYEPHSFVVSVSAEHQGQKHEWQYDSFEGRTAIEQAVADAMGVVTEVAGPATLHETVTAYGSLVLPPAGQRAVRARFDGEIVRVHKGLGDKVARGDVLFTIESNESLRTYALRSPMSGVIASLDGGAGEPTGDRTLARIIDVSKTEAELSVFAMDRARVKPGADVQLVLADGSGTVTGKVTFLAPQVAAGQAQTVRVSLASLPESWLPGQFVTGQIEVAQHPVELAVKKTGLQGFRDFTVVFAKVGEQYEVRMLELGREDEEWVEVLGGLKPGTEYVSGNSYLLKADVEKSGASHDH